MVKIMVRQKLEQWHMGGEKMIGKREREGQSERRETRDERRETREKEDGGGLREGGDRIERGEMKGPTDESLLKAILLSLSRSQIDQSHASDASEHQALFSSIAWFECNVL